MKIIPDPSLAALTTLKLGGLAEALVILEKPEDLQKLPETLTKIGTEPFWLGNGSNLLAKDENIALTLVKQKYGRPPEILEEVGEKVKVKVDAGYSLPAFLNFCLENSLSGMEGLRGIPGSIGGAVWMNAGSFGYTAADCLSTVEVMLDGLIKVYNINELSPEYRHLRFPFAEKNGLILNATFTLTHSQKHDILERMNQNFFEKKFRQPIYAKSAGCIFKNPADGQPAGILLDKAGFRGKRLGGMEFSSKHANFLVNAGYGTSAEALELIQTARDTVKDIFGIALELEVEILP